MTITIKPPRGPFRDAASERRRMGLPRRGLLGAGAGLAVTGMLGGYSRAATQDAAMFRAFFPAMHEQAVPLPPSGYEAWFLSAAHDDRALQHVINALPAAAAAAGREGKAE